MSSERSPRTTQRVSITKFNAGSGANPSIGPMMEYNETRVHFIGATLAYSLPVLNVRRGEILLRQAERDRVMEDRRRVEVQASLDVRAALDRIKEARRWAGYFGTESLPALSLAAEVIRSHHERWDGAGYPDALVGVECPLSARVVGLASVYDALRSRRSYRPALPHARVLRMMVNELAGQFDPTLLAALATAGARFEKVFKMTPD